MTTMPTTNHRRTILQAVLVLVIVVLVMVACGDDGDAAAPASTSGSTTSTSLLTEGDFEVFLLPDNADDCSAVIGVPRTAAVEGRLEDALTQLVAGPSEEEAAGGLRSWFSEDTAGMLNGVVVENKVAHVDFGDFSTIIPNASSSCGSASLLAQLDRTVLQFDEIDGVVYSFDGSREAFYEWLQLSAPE